MVTILLHSSKTMQHPASDTPLKQTPLLSSEANILAEYLKTLSAAQLETAMAVSAPMAVKTHALIEQWSGEAPTLPAIDAFLGDIYSGLQVQSFTETDRDYANRHLFILSGLYGILRALDTIQPYRLEMGYRLPGNAHSKKQPDITSLYAFWQDKIAQQLPKNQPIINLSAVEYTKAVFPRLKQMDGASVPVIISPKFLTVSPKTGEPTFVTVHAKIARGAFARWLIQHRVDTISDLKNFEDLGYAYAHDLSTETEPVFVAKEFKGIGLSVRLTKPTS